MRPEKQMEKHAKRTASLAKSAGNKAKPEVKGTVVLRKYEDMTVDIYI